MTCEEAVEKLYEYLDKELDQAVAAQLDHHLELCKICCDHFEFEKKMKKLVQDSCFKQNAPEMLKNKIMDNLSAID
jgi:mycothiol system anti-sigma-R factor